ncbi:Sin1 middle CRIM domain-containing protein [Entamoeba marina]
MTYLTHYINLDSLVSVVNVNEAISKMNSGNNSVFKKIECPLKINDFDLAIENEKRTTYVSYDSQTENTIQHQQSKSEVDMIFQVKPIPRIPRRVRTTIQINSYYIYFKTSSPHDLFKFCASPRSTVGQFIQIIIEKINASIKSCPNSDETLLREDPNTYQLKIASENGEEDEDFPIPEHTSRISDLGSFYFILNDNQEYLDRFKKHRRAGNNSNIQLAGHIATVKLFFKVRDNDNMSAVYEVTKTTKVKDFMLTAINERNKKLNFANKPAPFSVNIKDYDFRIGDDDGKEDDDITIDLDANIIDLGNVFVLIGKGKYAVEKPVSMALADVTKDKKDKHISQKFNSNELKLKESVTISTKGKSSSGKSLHSYTVFYDGNTIKVDFEETAEISAFIDEILLVANKTNVKIPYKNINDLVMYVAESDGTCDADFEVNKKTQIKDMCSDYFTIAVK